MVINHRNTENPISNLDYLAIFYLGLPLIFFYFNWLKPMVSIPLIVLNLGLFYYYGVRHINLKNDHFLNYLFSILLLISLGYGEILPQSGDWIKHNAIFTELYNHPNHPTLILFNKKEYLLCYGLGFYMIPSFLANIFNNYQLIPLFYLLYAALGLSIIGWYVKRIFKLNFYWLFLIFWIGRMHWLLFLKWQITNWNDFYRIFYRIGNDQFLSIIDQIPQHSLPIIICFLVLFNSLKSKNPNYPFLFSILTFSFFWSPFSVFAILPLIFIFPLIQPIKSLSKNKTLTTIVLFNLIILILYYSQHLQNDAVNFEKYSIKLFVFKFVFVYAFKYLSFIALFYYLYKNKRIIEYLEFKVIIVFFLFYFVYNEFQLGFFNDFSNKSTLLLPFFINVLLLKVLKNLDKIKMRGMSFFLVFITLFSMLMPIKISIMKFMAYENIPLQKKFECANYEIKKRNISGLNASLQETNSKYQHSFIQQYLGEKKNYFDIILKK